MIELLIIAPAAMFAICATVLNEGAHRDKRRAR